MLCTNLELTPEKFSTWLPHISSNVHLKVQYRTTFSVTMFLVLSSSNILDMEGITMYT